MALPLGFSVTALSDPAAGGHQGCLQAPLSLILLRTPPSTLSRRGFAGSPLCSRTSCQSVLVNNRFVAVEARPGVLRVALDA